MSGPLPDKSYYVIGAGIASIVVSAIAVILRCCSRSLVKAGFWWDDYITILSLVRQSISALELPMY